MTSNENPFNTGTVAARMKALAASIARKSATRPKVDAQGRLLEPPKFYRYDEHGQLIGPADETEPPAAT